MLALQWRFQELCVERLSFEWKYFFNFDFLFNLNINLYFRFKSSQRKPQPRAEEKTCRKARISTYSQSKTFSTFTRRKSRQLSPRPSRQWSPGTPRQRSPRSSRKHTSRPRISHGTWRARRSWGPRWSRSTRLKQHATRWRKNDGPSHDGSRWSRLPRSKRSNDGSI